MTGLASLSQRDRRAIRTGLAVIVSAAVLFRGYPAAQEWRSDVTQRAAVRELEWEAANRLLSRLPASLDSLVVRKERLAELPAFLVSGGSYTAGAANLTAHIAGIASSADVRLASTQVSADTTAAGAFSTITVRTGAVGPSAAIIRMIRELETQSPAISIEDWSITRTSPPRLEPGDEEIRIEFIARGLMINPSFER